MGKPEEPCEHEMGEPARATRRRSARLRSAAGSARTPVVRERLKAMISTSGLTIAEIGRRSGVSARAISGWRDSTKGNVDVNCLRRVVELLGCSYDYITGADDSVSTDEADFEPETIRNASGTWRITGQDLVVPGQFEYACEPKQWSGQLELRHQENNRSLIEGEGRDKDNDPLHFKGRIHLNTFIRGTYEIANDRLSIFGVLFVKFEMDGRTMNGHYLGHETGHRSGSILGTLRLELES